ncbi:apoptosis regulator BAX [Megalops cyprinoides]|uniref:apoptosis regulator BAX n=1 Tax=Megalops cyprinoides TaxID=118141 RepID=UPI0018648CA1|nr:apoptosis regulator BAX [Megalops cyprinoides]
MENEQQGAIGGEDTVDDRVMEEGAVLFRGYVVEMVNNHDPQIHLVPEDLGGRPNEGQEPQVKEVVSHLRKIADELNRNAELERLIDNVEFDSAQDLFFTVAKQIFSDGINWGRVVALFHFAYKLIYKALTQNHRDIIRRIIGWVLQFIRENVSYWIRQQGGWEGVVKSVLRWQSVTIFAAGVLTGALLYWKMAS